MDLVNVLLDGVLLGGLYAVLAAGLSLIFGVMRLVNVAHGDFIVLAAYATAAVAGFFGGLHPLLAGLLVVPVMAAAGYLLQRLLLNRTLGADLLPPLLVTFGLSVIIQNALLEIFRADTRRLQAGALETMHLDLPGGITVGVLPLLTFAAGVAVVLGLQAFFYRTALGRAFRAASDDLEAVRVLGFDHAHLFGLAMALSLAVVSVGAVFLGMRTPFDPSAGPTRLIYGFEAVIIGGLGDLRGTLVGGILLGVAQSAGARLGPGWQILAGHLLFLAVLLVRPQGLFPRTRGAG